MRDIDSAFLHRADAHVDLSNQQLPGANDDVGLVSASMMYATARFNAFWSAGTCSSREHFDAVREEVLEYLCKQYRLMLEDHLDDCAANFERYMGQK
jgi:hypothetical protein